MSEKWFSSINLFRRHQVAGQKKPSYLLESLSQAALVVNQKDQKITFVNEKAAVFFRQSVDFLEQLKFSDLVRGLVSLEGNPGNLSPGIFIADVDSESDFGVKGNVHLFVSSLEHQSLLVLLQPFDDMTRDQSFDERMKILLDQFSKLFSQVFPLKNSDLSQQSLLIWANDLLEADTTALYLADESSPAFLLVDIVGENPGIPNRLPPTDLHAFQNPYLWEADRRTLPVTSLTKSLDLTKIAYFESVPIGSPGAIIGILVIIARKNQPPGYTLQAINFISNLISYAIENQSLVSKMEDQISLLSESKQTHDISEEFIQEGVLVLTPQLSIIRINPSVEKIFGYKNSEVLNQQVQNIIIGSDSTIQTLKNIQSDSGYMDLSNEVLYRRNGEEFLANIHLLPVAPKKEIDSIVIIIEDLSEKERIRLQTEQLEQRAYVGEVTAVFAHEVRNPVNNISTGLQLLARNIPKNDPNQQEITRLLQDCDRLVDLMKSVLSISKPQDYKMEVIDLGDLLNRLINRRMIRLQNARITSEVKIDPLTPMVNGDIRGLEQVFNNLMNNAIQAMSDTGGDLVIKTRLVEYNSGLLDAQVDHPFVEISVADTGPGIPKEIQESIFQPFFSTRSTGTGLGLTIVKRIITLHGGTLRLDSFPGGTIFYVTLPAMYQSTKKPIQFPQSSIE